MLQVLKNYVPYWAVCGVVGISVGLLMYVLLKLTISSEVLSYLGAFVAVKLVLDEVKSAFEGHHVGRVRHVDR